MDFELPNLHTLNFNRWLPPQHRALSSCALLCLVLYTAAFALVRLDISTQSHPSNYPPTVALLKNTSTVTDSPLAFTLSISDPSMIAVPSPAALPSVFPLAPVGWDGGVARELQTLLSQSGSFEGTPVAAAQIASEMLQHRPDTTIAQQPLETSEEPTPPPSRILLPASLAKHLRSQLPSLPSLSTDRPMTDTTLRLIIGEGGLPMAVITEVSSGNSEQDRIAARATSLLRFSPEASGTSAILSVEWNQIPSPTKEAKP